MVVLVHYVWFGVVLFLTAFLISWMAYPIVLRMARVWGFYDNPDARKLQRRPVPVMGGLAVFIGILVPTLILITISFNTTPLIMLLSMAFLFGIGMVDDRIGLSPGFRFLIEIATIFFLIMSNGSRIDSLHGLWTVGGLPVWVSYLLSIVAGVGIINAINMIDGVDGYSSGYIIMACTMFAYIFYAEDVYGMAIICLICAGSTVPFFLHNVFGKKAKMFIGDGGTLMLGTLMAAFVFSILKSSSLCANLETNHNISLIATALAILSVPVFDTLRVMIYRMAKCSSPFKADKTHLHHLFIDLGFSHIGTTACCLFFNILVVASEVIAWKLGAGMETQFYVVVGMSVMVTAVFYGVVRTSMKRNGAVARALTVLGSKSHVENTALWKWLRKMVDDELFEEGRHEHNITDTDDNNNK